VSNTLNTPAYSSKCHGLTGTLKIPGDKSISHRSLIIASQLLGNTTIYGMLEGEDVLCTAAALRLAGVVIEQRPASWHVSGVGIGGLKEPANIMDMGNSGTSTRLLAGLFSSYPFLSVFTGDASLRKRPMKRVVSPLSLSGAQFMPNEQMTLPLAMKGSALPLPISYTLPVASAQVKSAIMLAALNIQGTSTIIEPIATRDHTERMFQAVGIPVTVEKHGDATHISVTGCVQQHYQDREIYVPADPSSAAFLTVAALIVPNSHVTMKNVCINDTRIGIYTTLKEMGADITFANQRIVQGEPVADIMVTSSALRGVTIPAERAPSMIDEYPILAIAASVAKGQTIMQDLHELRVKESNRFDAIVNGLKACGASVVVDGDNIIVTGKDTLQGGVTISTNLDHRIAMSYLVMGLITQQPVTVDDIGAINTSFPEFISLMREAGARISVQKKEVFKRSLTVAIDGPAASGKGTLARKLADYLGVRHLDTGGLYRAAALKLLAHKGDPNNVNDVMRAAQQIDYHDLANTELRSEHVGNMASIISAIPEVRRILLDFQQKFANNPEGAVLDGRDIGTVVCPDADVKIFITASIEARALRRHQQLQNEGIEVVYESVLADLIERDERDKARNIAPLKAADNAMMIDTTEMTVEDVFIKVTELLNQRLAA
jgi:3-phosphoshikimate 1-carboxyvinyltransferase